MTLKTEVIFLQVKRRIEFFREIGDQTPEYIGAMWRVTGNTVILFDWSMFERILFHLFGDVFQNCSILPLYPLIMTG